MSAHKNINTLYHEELMIAASSAAESYTRSSENPNSKTARNIKLETAIRHIQIDTISDIAARLRAKSCRNKIAVKALESWARELSASPVEDSATE